MFIWSRLTRPGYNHLTGASSVVRCLEQLAIITKAIRHQTAREMRGRYMGQNKFDNGLL